MNPFQTLPLPVADRLAATLDGLARAVAARSARGPSWLGGLEALAGLLIILIWTRVKRADVKIQALLARLRAGTLRVAAARRPREGRRESAPATRPRAEIKVPRRFGWLLPLVPCEAAGFAAQLRLHLAEPEMVALLAACPQARRILAPVCRMLAIEPDLLVPPQARRDAGPVGAVAEPGADGELAEVGLRPARPGDPARPREARHRPTAMRATDQPDTGPDPPD